MQRYTFFFQLLPRIQKWVYDKLDEKHITLVEDMVILRFCIPLGMHP